MAIRSVNMHLRFSVQESQRLHHEFQGSTSQSLSEFCRRKLLNKPVVFRLWNQSVDDFVSEMIELRKELFRVREDLKTLVERFDPSSPFLETKDPFMEMKQTWQAILQAEEAIKTATNKTSESWWSELNPEKV
jgi:hypothetical protein